MFTLLFISVYKYLKLYKFQFFKNKFLTSNNKYSGTGKETIKKNVDVFLQKLTEHIINFHRDNLTLGL